MLAITAAFRLPLPIMPRRPSAMSVERVGIHPIGGRRPRRTDDLTGCSGRRTDIIDHCIHRVKGKRLACLHQLAKTACALRPARCRSRRSAARCHRRGSFRASASPSGVFSLSVISKHLRSMSCHVAVDIDSDRQPCNVRGHGKHVYSQRGGPAAKAPAGRCRAH